MNAALLGWLVPPTYAWDAEDLVGLFDGAVPWEVWALALATFDAVMFGLWLTRQRWGDPAQRRAWESLPKRARRAYHGGLGVLQASVALWLLWTSPDEGNPLALHLLAANHDLVYHLVLGHVRGWGAFSRRPKAKPTNALYWPVRWAVLAVPAWRRAYPVGVPAWAETSARLLGAALVVWADVADWAGLSDALRWAVGLVQQLV